MPTVISIVCYRTILRSLNDKLWTSWWILDQNVWLFWNSRTSNYIPLTVCKLHDVSCIRICHAIKLVRWTWPRMHCCIQSQLYVQDIDKLCYEAQNKVRRTLGELCMEFITDVSYVSLCLQNGRFVTWGRYAKFNFNALSQIWTLVIVGR